MKKAIFIILAAVVLFSCKKKEVDPVQPEQDVVFSASQIYPQATLKSTEDWECKDLPADYAKVQIDDLFYYPAVFRIGGRLFTQAIKLPVPESGSRIYSVNMFLVMHDSGVIGDYSDDTEIIMATPTTDGIYKEYVTRPVSFEFTLDAFTKMEIPIDVLCFRNQVYQYFGFDWFQVTEIVVRQQCFFGDMCFNDEPYSPDDYLTSLYDAEQLPAGCQVDMPAIMQIVVKKDGVEVENSPFTNAAAAAGYGVGAPLCVEYPDDLSVTEVFSFELWLLVKNAAGGFSYQLYHTWQVVDSGLITAGEDGVVDFTVGTCNVMPADFTFGWLDPPAPLK